MQNHGLRMFACWCHSKFRRVSGEGILQSYMSYSNSPIFGGGRFLPAQPGTAFKPDSLT